MPRQLRLIAPGGVYHVTARGNRRQLVYVDDRDRALFMALLNDASESLRWEAYAYCLMPNHYHLVVMTPEANLSRGIQLINGTYAQRFNRRHGKTGHLFQGDSILLESTTTGIFLSLLATWRRTPFGLAFAPGLRTGTGVAVVQCSVWHGLHSSL